MDTYRIKVLQKLFKILDLFFGENVELTTREIAKAVGLNRTSTFRIISNLENEGYLEFDPKTSKYRLGLKLIVLGSHSNPFLHLKRVTRPFLEDLNHQTGETVHLAVLRGRKAFYLDKIEGKKTIRVVISQVGQELPAHCTGVGKLLLAFIPEKDAQKLVSENGMPVFTNNTLTSWSQLKAELQKIREEGLSRDQEEIEYGLSCLAAPIYSGEKVVAATSVSMPIDRMKQDYSEIRSLVTKTAKNISKQLKDNFLQL